MDNAFGVLKETWSELEGKTKLNLKYLPDVFTTCIILHNALLNQGEIDAKCLLELVDNERLDSFRGGRQW